MEYENDFHKRGAKDKLSGRTFRYFCSLVSNQRKALHELNGAHFKLLAKRDQLEMRVEELEERIRDFEKEPQK